MREYIFPSSSAIEMPSLSIAAADSLVGFAILVSKDLSVVPAMSALMPLLAMRPSAMAVSSMEYPRDPARGAAYLKDSPNIETLVLELTEAAARTSAKCAASFASRPKAVSASVTISDTLASSSPEAAASSMIGAIPSSMSADFHPAIPIYSKACAASVAVNLVEAPIS